MYILLDGKSLFNKVVFKFVFKDVFKVVFTILFDGKSLFNKVVLNNSVFDDSVFFL